ncbi:MAG TPA: hypothetical protein VHQ87_11845 [Rhizobacter sp.]|nr:hypothetical protein [Rhizobacter sp.]
MSGYFAQLAAQVRGPMVAASPTAGVAPLEQHVEVEVAAAPSGGRDAGEVSVPPFASTSTAALPAALPRNVRAPQALATGLMGAEAPSMGEPPVSMPARALGPVATPMPVAPASSTRTITRDGAPPARISPLREETRIASPMPEPNTTGEPPAETAARGAAAPAEPRGDTTQPGHRFIEVQQPRVVPATPGVPAATSPAVSRPRAVATPAAAIDTSPARETPAAARTEVRIGTIALQVHSPPPAAAPRPAPQPLAAPTPALPRFSLQRHYLRWS